MKRTEYMSVGDVCRIAFEEFNMTERLLERRACDFWRDLVGPAIAGMAGRPEVSRGVMRIGISDASLRHELTMNRSVMIRHINDRLGRPVITEIRFTAP